MEIPRATFAQVLKGQGGKKTLISEDLQDISWRLYQLDPALKLHWNEKGEYFVVTEDTPDGRQHIVTTALEIDSRLVDHVASLRTQGYSKKLEEMDDRAKKLNDYKLAEEVGEIGERLAHALRKDLSYQGKIFLPKGVNVA